MLQQLTDHQLQQVKGGTSLQPRSVGVTNNGAFQFDWLHWIFKK